MNGVSDLALPAPPTKSGQIRVGHESVFDARAENEGFEHALGDFSRSLRDASRLLIAECEFGFGGAARGTNPIVGKIREASAGRNASIGPPGCLVVNLAAGTAFPFAIHSGGHVDRPQCILKRIGTDFGPQTNSDCAIRPSPAISTDSRRGSSSSQSKRISSLARC